MVTAVRASRVLCEYALIHTVGTTLYRYGDSFGGIDGMRIIKAGVLDDINVINSIKPSTELFAPERVSWVNEIDGANQVPAMPQ